MHSFLKKYILFVLFFISNLVFSQDLSPKQITIKDGLSSNTVNKVFVDDNLNVWIGTSLNTYIYKNGNLYPFFLKNEHIKGCSDIYQDPSGNIWFSTNENGVYKYTGKELVNYSQANGLISNTVNKVYAKGDFVYFATQKGVSILNKTTNIISNPNVKQFKKFLEFTVLNFIEINNQVYFITQTDGFFKIVNENNKPRILKIRNHNYLSSIYLWNNRIYVGEKKNLLIFSIQDYLNNSQAMHQLPIYNVSDFCVNGNKLIAISKGENINEGGLYRIQEDNSYDEFDNFPKLISKSFNSVFLSPKETSSYIATEFDGFLAYDLSPDKRFYKNENSIITDIKPFNNDILILSNNKIELKTISEVTKATLTISELAKKVDLSKYSINKIQFNEVITSKDSIYIKTNIGKFVLNNTLTHVNFVSELDEPLVLFNNELFDFSKYYHGIKSNDFIGTLYDSNPNKLPINLSQSIAFKQKIVVSTKGNGLYTIENSQVKSLIDSKEFLENRIKLIKKNISDNLLVVTQFNKVYELLQNNKFKVKKHFNTSKLVGQNIFYVDTYNEFNVFGTEAGIEFLKDDFHYVLNKEYGITLSNIIVANIIGDYLYVGGNGGYYKFHIPKFLAYKNEISNVFISAIYTSKGGEKKGEADWINGLSNKIIINEEDLPISVSFFPKDKIDNPGLLYRFRLKPESTWSDYTSKASLQILKVNEGNLDIEVEFFDKITQTTSSFKLLEIQVKTNYTKFLIVFSTLLLLASIGVYIYLQNEKLYKAFLNIYNSLDFNLLEVSNSASQVKVDLLSGSAHDLIVLANQANDVAVDRKMLLNAVNSHFVFNIFNFLQYIILEKKPKEAVDYSNDFAQFFRQFLKIAKNTHVSLANEIEFLQAYVNLESKRFNYIVNLKFDNPDTLDYNDIYVPSFILHPLTETIFNFSYNEDSEKVNIEIVFEDFDENSILVNYFYDGVSIQELNSDANGRLGKEITLLKECLKHNNSDNYCEITFNDIPKSKNKITFRIDV